MTEHRRVEFSMAAVRIDDYAAIRDALDDVRRRFCKGGSSLSWVSLAEGTVIRDV